MAKLLRHFGLGGKKTTSQQSRQEYSPQGIQAKAPGVDRISGIVGEGGRFECLRDGSRRHSECGTLAVPLSFESRTRERDWSLRGPNSSESPGDTVNSHSPVRSSPVGNLSQEGLSSSSSASVAPERAAVDDTATKNTDNQVPLSTDYSNPFDLKKENADIPEVTAIETMEPVSEDDYSVPYGLKQFKDLQVVEETGVKQKYDDPYELSPTPTQAPTTQLTNIGLAGPDISHYRNLPIIAAVSAQQVVMRHDSRQQVAAAAEEEERRVSAEVAMRLSAEINGKDDEDDQENYMDLQEEEIIPRSSEMDSWRTAPQSVRDACINANNYDEPWDLALTRRDLEERLRAVQKFEPMASKSMDKMQQSFESADGRPPEGYDKPWDLQPHLKDTRGQDGYDKPWDLKPHLKDMRPAQEYEMPWDKKVRDIERDLIAAKRAKDAGKVEGLLPSAMGPSVVQAGIVSQTRPDSSRQVDTRPGCEYDEPWDQKKKQLIGMKGCDPTMKTSHPPSSAGSPFQQVSGRDSGPWVKTIGERIDPKLPLEQQSWYHGSISRVDAENLLRVHQEGSYLVRTSESNKLDYSLSVKSVRGFMHMKIVTNAEGRYILGQFSQPFYSIPQMIYHYTVNKLPIKGAEHMSLMYPISNELL